MGERAHLRRSGCAARGRGHQAAPERVQEHGAHAQPQGREHGYTARNTESHPPLAELWRAQQDLDRWYVETYDAMDEVRLKEKVRFSFVGGGEGVMTRGEVLQHLVNHTTYHRGFVAQMIYDVPARPPVTDLTVFLRDAPPRPE